MGDVRTRVRSVSTCVHMHIQGQGTGLPCGLLNANSEFKSLALTIMWREARGTIGRARPNQKRSAEGFNSQRTCRSVALIGAEAS